jgi:hypothetical protein
MRLKTVLATFTVIALALIPSFPALAQAVVPCTASFSPGWFATMLSDTSSTLPGTYDLSVVGFGGTPSPYYLVTATYGGGVQSLSTYNTSFGSLAINRTSGSNQFWTLNHTGTWISGEHYTDQHGTNGISEVCGYTAGVPVTQVTGHESTFTTVFPAGYSAPAGSNSTAIFPLATVSTITTGMLSVITSNLPAILGVLAIMLGVSFIVKRLAESSSRGTIGSTDYKDMTNDYTFETNDKQRRSIKKHAKDVRNGMSEL